MVLETEQVVEEKFQVLKHPFLRTVKQASTLGKAMMSPFFFFQFQITPEYHDFCPIAVLNLYLLWLLLAYQLPNLTFIFNPGLDLLGASISPGHSHQLRTHSFFLPDTYSLFISVPQPHCVLILYVWVLDFGISISAMVIFCSCFDYIQMDGS